MKKTILVTITVFTSMFGFSQTKLDSIQKLEEVVLSDVKLQHFATGYKVTKIKDSVITKNAPTLTGLLAFNSNIYFKENGFGMLSSPSFRGTNASQTAVIWNGININSQLNGQTDFNLINTLNFDSIDILSGGGSVQYGSGSIGGSVHLNNRLKFYSHFNNELRVSYGSFKNKNISYANDFGTDKWSGNLGVSYIDSDNDYKFLGTDKVNTNGAFNNVNINANLGYFISKRDVLKLYHQSFISDRQLSSTLIADSKSKYEDENSRTLLEWSRINEKSRSQFKVAHIQELFRFFADKDIDDYSFGKVNTLLLKHNFNLELAEGLQVQSVLDYNYIEANGSSFGNPNRRAFSATGLLSHQLNDKFSYGINFRKDFVSDFESPFVFSADASYELTKAYTLKLNGSKNFRIPTINDLYWQPGGNLDLKPETSYQVDFGQEFNHKLFNFKLNAFYITTEDLILWKPNISGIWSPQNIAETENYGIETELEIKKQFGKHTFKLKGNYSYTVSEDKETGKQLIYVPFHKANVNFGYNFKRFSFFYQQLFNGEVFITDDNLRGRLFSLNDFNVANIGLNYTLLKTESNTLDIGFNLNNIYNQVYQNVVSRPMPNRNFNIQLHYKF